MVRASVLPLMILASVSAVAAPVAPASAAPVEVPARRTLRPTATAGRPLRVSGYASWNTDCSAQPPPVIRLRTEPSHGRVSILPGDSTVKFVRVGSVDCSGRVYPGTVVWYTPDEGYKGRDRFDLDIENQTSNPAELYRHDMVLVQVR